MIELIVLRIMLQLFELLDGFLGATASSGCETIKEGQLASACTTVDEVCPVYAP